MQVLVGQNYGSYTFNASTGVITLSNLPTALAAGQVKLILNARTNTLIFNLADPNQTATISGNTITLAYNTSAMSDSDPLQIFLEVPGEFVTQEQTAIVPLMSAVAGITNDVTPQYKSIPLTAGGASVKIDGSAVTQPVSGTVGISGTIPVSGTFWQATQPVSGSVAVSNFPPTQAVTGTFWQATQPVSSTQLPAALDGSGNLKVSIQSGSVTVGSVSVSNFPTTQAVSGTVGISGTVPVSGTFWQTTQPVSGSVSVSNFPATQPVSIASAVAVTGTFWQATQPVSGSVSVSNFPTTQTVAFSSPQHVIVDSGGGSSGDVQYTTATTVATPTGTVALGYNGTNVEALAVDGSGNLKVFLENSSISVTGTFWQTTQPVSGTVGISGTVPVSGTFWQTTQPISGSVSVSNFPTTQTVTGTVAVTGTFFQTTQPVSSTQLPAALDGSGNLKVSIQSGTVTVGSVSVSNFPTTQVISGTVGISGTVPVSIAATVATSNTQLPGALDGSGYLKVHEQGTANVSIQNSSIPVTGTFYPATQPVSGTVGISGTVPVSGTFWQATQPVSGSVSVSNFPATQAVSISGTVPVSGTFWQTTQPVTDAAAEASLSTIASAVTSSQMRVNVTNVTLPVSGTVGISGTVPVTGTFWQATQPVSGSVTSNQGVASAGAKWSVQVDNALAIAVTDAAAEASLSTLAGAVTSSNLQVNVTNTSIPVTNTVIDVSPSSQSITAQDSGSTSTSGANNQILWTGTPTVGSVASFALSSGYDTTRFLITGTWTGTLTVEMSLDGGTTWTSQEVHQTGTTFTTSSFTGNFSGQANTAGFTNVRVRSTTAFTGTAIVLITASVNPASVYVGNSINISDAYSQSTSATIKPASTVAAASDNSIVVQLNPNQPLLTTPLNVSVVNQLDGTIIDTQNSITATGPGITYDVAGYGFLSFQFGGSWAGFIHVESSNDGVAWTQQYTQVLGTGVITDNVTLPAVVLVESATLYMRYNVIEINHDGVLTVTVVGNTGSIPTTSLLGMAFDSDTGVQLNTSVTNFKQDTSNALVLSDAPAPINIQGGIGSFVVVDTQGYQSLSITTQSMAASVTSSNDRISWASLSGLAIAIATLSTTVTSNATYTFPCLGRYVRFQFTTAGAGVVYLRNSPWQSGYNSSVAATNISSVAGTATVTAGVAGVLAVGGNIAVGVAQTTNPIVVGGIDTGNLTRRILTDTSGRLITASVDQSGTTRPINTLSPANSFQNVASLAVSDISMFEGQSITDLLAQILIELRISNYYQFNLPALLTTGTTNVASDEPAAFRNDPALPTVFG